MNNPYHTSDFISDRSPSDDGGNRIYAVLLGALVVNFVLWIAVLLAASVFPVKWFFLHQIPLVLIMVVSLGLLIRIGYLIICRIESSDDFLTVLLRSSLVGLGFLIFLNFTIGKINEYWFAITNESATFFARAYGPTAYIYWLSYLLVAGLTQALWLPKPNLLHSATCVSCFVLSWYCLSFSVDLRLLFNAGL